MAWRSSRGCATFSPRPPARPVLKLRAACCVLVLKLRAACCVLQQDAAYMLVDDPVVVRHRGSSPWETVGAARRRLAQLMRLVRLLLCLVALATPRPLSVLNNLSLF